MGAREVLRTFVRPVWTAGPPKVEAWTCPACGRAVERTSPAWKGIWFTATAQELTALCSRTFRAHDRTGLPLAAEDSEEGDAWVPIVAVTRAMAGEVPSAFVALLPPSGRAYVRVGDAYEVRELEDLSASDLVGTGVASLPGHLVARLPVASVVFDDASDPAAIAVN